MKDKALKYTIVLLLIPLMASLLIAIITNNNSSNNVSGNMNSGEIPTFNNKTEVEEIKSTDTYMYISVFTLCAISGVVLIYIKNKRGI